MNRFARLATLAPGSRFRFHAPKWSVRWDGEVVENGFTDNGLPCVFVRMDTVRGEIDPEKTPSPWQPDILVEVLRDGPGE